MNPTKKGSGTCFFLFVEMCRFLLLAILCFGVISLSLLPVANMKTKTLPTAKRQLLELSQAVPRKEVRTIAGSSAGFLDANGSAALFSRPIDVAFDDNSGMLYMTDFYNHRIRVIHVASTVVTTLAGSGTKAFADGVGTSAKFANPSGIAVTSDGSHLFVADMFNNRIRMIATYLLLLLAQVRATARRRDGQRLRE